jgi:hypothetical protein
VRLSPSAAAALERFPFERLSASMTARFSISGKASRSGGSSAARLVAGALADGVTPS